MKKTSINIYFDKRRMRAGMYSVKYAVYFNGVQRYFASGLELDEKEVAFLKKNKQGLSGHTKQDYQRNLWNKVYGATYIDDISGEVKEGYLIKAERALAKIESYFSFELFTKVISGEYTPEQKVAYPTDLIQALTDRAHVLKGEGNVGNAAVLTSSAFSFARFAVFKKITTEAKPRLPLQIITVAFLKQYEAWMLKYGKAAKAKSSADSPASITYVGINCRNVRTVFNEAIAAGVIDQHLYPFGKSGYRIPKAKNQKRALDEGVAGRIMAYECKSGSFRKRSRDFWLLSYLCSGMNFTDIFNLKWNQVNLDSGWIEIVREKTREATKEDQTAIKIHLLPEAVSIIQEWANEERVSHGFVFPYLNDTMSASKKKAVVRQIIRVTNENMDKIAKELELNIPIHTYSARHSFATTLLRSEAPIAFISQQLGHTSFKTTQGYLGSFEDEQAQKYLGALIPKKEAV